MALPSLVSRSEDFLSSPRQDSEGQAQHHHLVWQPVRGIKQACQLASLPANGKLGKRIFPRVQAAWLHLRAELPSTPAAEVKGQDKPSARDACRNARTCVCRKSGRSHLAIMASNLKKAFRLVASSRHGRADLLAARAVVAVIGRAEQQCVEATAKRAPLQEQTESNLAPRPPQLEALGSIVAVVARRALPSIGFAVREAPRPQWHMRASQHLRGLGQLGQGVAMGFGILPNAGVRQDRRQIQPSWHFG